MTGGLALDVVGERKDQLAHFTRLNARAQRGQIKVVRPHAMNRREPPVQDMIHPAVSAAALKRDQIRHVLDHAHQARVAPFIRANRAQAALGQIAATRATPHRDRGLLQSRHQCRQLRRFFHQQMQRDAFR